MSQSSKSVAFVPDIDRIPLLPDLSLDQIQTVKLYQTLRSYGWNRSRTAKELNVSAENIRKKVRVMREIGIEIPDSIGKKLK